ncbi:MAG TPA: SurA N-terminal domain-containing protein [Hyphomicrobiaceae bacterium]|nr:SurA N-terminal domain-containing protein [Hyphomicrobiaceae bacterium]
MLDSLRRGALNWFAKGLLGLLVIAFAVWGIGDVIRNVGRGTLATIGGSQITVDEYRQAYQDEMASLTRRFGRRLTNEQAKLLGVEQRALARLISAAAIDHHARDLKLALSDQGIAEIIRNDPGFQGPDGKFSKELFQTFLRQIGLSEGRYVYTRRQEELRDQLTESLLSGLAPPQAMLDALYRYREERRVIDFFTPDFDKLIKLGEPDDAKLRAYYDENKARFTAPERRKINVLLLTREAAKQRISISEDELKAAYDSDKQKFNIPEMRRITQLTFPDKAAAETAYVELSKAPNFAEAAAKLGFKESDIELGLLAKRDMIDSRTAEAAFALKQDELSQPVEGQFATVLIRVTEVVPGKQRTFDEVKGEIGERLAEERANLELQNLHESIENDRYSGKPLKEIGEKLKLPFLEIADIDRTGKTADGKPALEQADAGKIAQAAFAGNSGIEAEAVELPDGGNAWVDVLQVTPEKQKTFEEVAGDVKTQFMEQQRRTEVSNLAAKFVDRLNQGEAFETVAAEAGAKAEKTNPVTRSTSPPGLTSNAVQQAFTLPKSRAASAATTDGRGRTIIRVAEISPAPEPTPEQIAALKGELNRQLQSDILAEYIAGLQARYGLSVNQEALRQALGGERGAEAPMLE